MRQTFSRAYDWCDERTGIRTLIRHALDEPIRGGARWAYVFGSILVFLFLLQVVTGIFLTMYYVPSADHAHTSVAYIQKVIPGGSMVRGLHVYGASAMVIFLFAHLAQTFLFGSYKGKRELLWGFGVIMMLIVFGFAFTGYLLPWDQEAYFGTKVGTSIAGEVPVVGQFQQHLLLGGNNLTTLSLSRFFTIHTFLLPTALVLLIIGHIYLFRVAGAAGSFSVRNDHKVELFYPKQLLLDSVGILLVFLGLVWMVYKIPAQLGPQADPTSDFLARPPWYFLPLFELLKYFPGKLSLIPTVILPAVLFGVLFALPFFDKRPTRNPLHRPLATTLMVITILGSVGLIVASKYQDRKDPDASAKLKKQEEDSQAFLKAEFKPEEIGKKPEKSAPGAAAATIKGEPPDPYTVTCSLCHGDHGEGAEGLGPSLVGITSKPNRTKEDLLKILNDPRSYGLKDPMPANFPDLSDADKHAIVDWIGAGK
ncbi:MAG TPA: cytochrome b N-terminal domain-containing protein [Blastocatellia bacterium]|nr:cytochrome b N-terminal domain-containing protein [Blastocatellia bacterium]